MFNNPYQNQPMMNNFAIQQASPVVWVQGVEQAKALTMPYNAKLGISFDRDKDIMYITTLDDMGRPSTKMFSYSQYVEQEPAPPVTREEFDALRDMVKKLSPSSDEIGE